MTIKVNYIDFVKLRLFSIEYDNYADVKRTFVRISHSDTPTIAPIGYSVVDGELYSQDSDDIYYWYNRCRDKQIALIYNIKEDKK